MVPQIAPGQLAWIEGAANWELNRRWGLNCTLLPPEAAIPAGADSVGIDATVIIKAQLAQDARRLQADGRTACPASPKVRFGGPGYWREHKE